MLDPGKRQVVSWAFYDWANSAFATVVIAGFFPIFFKEFWSVGVEPTISTFRLGAANSIASLVVLCLAPILGAIADQGAYKKRFLLFLAAVGAVATAGLDKDRLREAIRHGTFETINGPVKFDGVQNSVTPTAFLQLQEGEMHLIWPSDIATSAYKPR